MNEININDKTTKFENNKFSIEKWTEVITELEKIDESKKIKHIPRKKWTEDMIKNKILLWQIPRPTAELIYQLVKLKEPRIILEFGTSGGYSGLWMARALEEIKESKSNETKEKKTEQEYELHTIEFSEYRFEISRNNFRKTGLSNRVKQYKGKIQKFIEDWNLMIDFLFIDADKPNYLNHFKMIENKLNKGSVIIADNILDNPPKVKDFVEYFKTNNNYSTTIIPIDNGLLFAIKK